MATKTTALKAKLYEKIEAFRPRIQKLNKELANVVIDKVNISLTSNGMDLSCYA